MLGTAVASAERKDDVKLSVGADQGASRKIASLRVTHAQDTGETLIEGQGEMHLRVALERLTGKYGITVNTHEPADPLQGDDPRRRSRVRGRHKKQSGGHGQFGDVELDIKPLPRGSGFVFAETVTGGVGAEELLLVDRGGRRASTSHKGPLGFPVVDVSVTLTDGSYHAVDSSDMAFRTAAQIGMREGMPQCRPVLLEPVLKVEVAVPSEATPRVNGIVSQRRGQILGFDARPGWKGWDVVEAQIPQSEIRDLIVELRSATAGVGTFSAPLRSSCRTDRQGRRPDRREGAGAGGLRVSREAPRHRDLIVRFPAA